jgi:hypothetical protein
MNEARENLTKYFGDLDKSNISKLNESATAAQAALFANNCALLKKQVADNTTQITAYKAQLQKLETPESAGDLQNTFAITAGIPPAPQTPLPQTQRLPRRRITGPQSPSKFHPATRQSKAILRVTRSRLVVEQVGDSGLQERMCLIRTPPQTPRSRWQIRTSKLRSIA